jgi:hypothetical protein
MGIYSDYLDRQLGFSELTTERKKQLERISTLRGGRDVLVFAADLNKSNAPISIGYSDILPIDDQLSNLCGKAIDVILETPGGRWRNRGRYRPPSSRQVRRRRRHHPRLR